ncbi:MAG TPA: DUF3352 domain-containing protein [Actinomycetota bacterium]|nr:DUF3352 domain-containing protein [Actinomycetota bacterium]
MNVQPPKPPPPPPAEPPVPPSSPGPEAISPAPDPSASDGPAPRRHLVRTILTVVVVVLFVATGAVAVGLYALRGSGEGLTRMIPASAEVYVSIDLDPSLRQKLNVERLAGKFPSLHGSAGVNDAVDGAMNDALSSMVSGVSFHRDVRPWLGSQIALVGSLSSGNDDAIILESTDDAAAQHFLNTVISRGPAWQDVSYRGVTLHVGRSGASVKVVVALVDHAVVIGGNLAMVEHVVATDQGGPRLDQTAGYTATVRTLPSDRIGLVYVSTAPLRKALGGFESLSPLDSAPATSPLGVLGAARGLGVSLSADPDGVAVDVSMPLDQTKLSAAERRSLASAASYRPLLAWVPAGAFGFLASPAGATSPGSSIRQIGTDSPPELRRMLARWHISGPNGVVAHLTGDMVVEAGPGPPGLQGAMILGTDDEASTSAALNEAAPAIARSLSGETSSKVKLPPGLTKAQRRKILKEVGPFKPPSIRWSTVSQDGTTLHVAKLVVGSHAQPLFAYSVADGAAILSTSSAGVSAVLAAHRGAPSAAGDPEISAALRGGLSDRGAVFYVDLQRVLQFANSSGANLQGWQALRSLLVSSKTSPAGVTARLFVSIR